MAEQKVALVTGAGQGIGRCIAKRLLEEGYAVAIADIDGEAARETASLFGRKETAVAYEVDVADEPAVKAMIADMVASFGHLDTVVNNAAIANAHLGPVETLELAQWNRLLASNLTGVFLCSKHAVPHLRLSKGTIINIASTRAVQSEPGTEAYAASKGGVVALTHALAMSLGPEIRVNCISPGWIAVDDWKKSGSGREPELRPEDHAQHPVGRVGRPDDIAEMALYLASPRAGFITGQNLVVDGGMTRKMIYLE
ncbi:MAG TPA: glucose 1-dehydrogenase [Geomonas sp.]|nr:glucose 1-dehydrogenase [Geomonas sp.]